MPPKVYEHSECEAVGHWRSGYRQADRRNEHPLTDDERLWFRQVIQRIAALLALGLALDSRSKDAAAGAFTAAELNISR